MKAGKTAAGSTPSERTSPLVYEEIVRTASALRTAVRATASASGASARRHGDP